LRRNASQWAIAVCLIQKSVRASEHSSGGTAEAASYGVMIDGGSKPPQYGLT